MGWNQQFSLQGPKGDQGDPGIQGPKGDDGPTGPAGADGKSISIAGQVATYADLPTGLNSTTDAGKGYLVDADGLLYVWGGTSFPAEGAGVEFRGEQGPVGAKGDTGDAGPANTLDVTSVTTGSAGSQAQVTVSGSSPNQHLQFVIPQGAKGDQGDPGAPGTDGSDGADGARGTKWFYGLGGPGTIAGAQVGDFYLDTTPADQGGHGTVYVLT